MGGYSALMSAHRHHAAYWAFIVHRLSGVGLALFLPAHFLVLGLALEEHAALDGVLRWTESPAVKIAEMGLVILLAAHLAGGLRLLAVEFLPWRDWQKTAIAAVAGLSLVAGFAFILSAG